VGACSREKDWGNEMSTSALTNDILEKLKLVIFDLSLTDNGKVDVRLKEYYNKLLRLKKENAIVLAKYTLSYKQDNPGMTNSTLSTYCLYLVRFALKVNKSFGDMTRDDLLEYLETMKKPDSDRWKGTWNMFLVIITRFFKWFYYPDIPSSERVKPPIVTNLKKAKPKGGKRKKVFGPKDLWNFEDNEIFFKYCPNPRIKGYHGLAIDLGARPHELLQLKIEDIVWPPDGQGPKIQLNGKTGPRTVRSLRYYKYLMEWWEQHPKRSIPSAILFPSKKTGGILNVGSLRTIYIKELRPFFVKLLDDPIGQEDRNKINRLLEKSWTPKVFRHTTATEYSSLLSNPDANQWFGWTENSNTSSFYRHYNGDESSKSLMVAFGLSDPKQRLPRQRECTNVTCKELNTLDAPFCVKCRIPLTVPGYMEEGHRKEQEIDSLRDEILETRHQNGELQNMVVRAIDGIKRLDSEMNYYRNRWLETSREYQMEFGLTSKTKRKLAELKKQSDDLPDVGEIEGEPIEEQ
jgi:integrase